MDWVEQRPIYYTNVCSSRFWWDGSFAKHSTATAWHIRCHHIILNLLVAATDMTADMASKRIYHWNSSTAQHLASIWNWLSFAVAALSRCLFSDAMYWMCLHRPSLVQLSLVHTFHIPEVFNTSHRCFVMSENWTMQKKLDLVLSIFHTLFHSVHSVSCPPRTTNWTCICEKYLAYAGSGSENM